MSKNSKNFLIISQHFRTISKILLRLSKNVFSLVYLLFPTFRETLQGGFLEVFTLFSGQCSVYFPGNISGENPRQTLFSLLISF